MTHENGIPTPYNSLPDGQAFYVWQEDAKARIASLTGCSLEDAGLVLSEVRDCAARGHAHEPIRTQALREAARAHRIYPGTDEVVRMRHAIGSYFSTLNLAGRLERGTISQADATDELKRERERRSTSTNNTRQDAAA